MFNTFNALNSDNEATLSKIRKIVFAPFGKEPRNYVSCFFCKNTDRIMYKDRYRKWILKYSNYKILTCEKCLEWRVKYYKYNKIDKNIDIFSKIKEAVLIEQQRVTEYYKTKGIEFNASTWYWRIAD